MKIHVVKIGGHLINDKNFLNIFLKSFCKLSGYKILIHGGGEIANIILDKMKIPKKIIQGRRITDKRTLEVAIMTYAGIINKNIVALLQYYKCNAIGLCGADGNCIQSEYAKKEKNIDYGYVGEIKNSKSINTNLIKFLLINNITPVLCPITHNGFGTLLNTNADTIASNVAISLSKKYEIELHFCFEKKGVLKNIYDSDSFFHKVNFKLFLEMKKNSTIYNGMIPKLENAFFALKNGVYRVSIGSYYSLNDLYNKTIIYL